MGQRAASLGPNPPYVFWFVFFLGGGTLFVLLCFCLVFVEGLRVR